MSLIASAVSVVERAPLPDSVLRMGVGYLVGRTRDRLSLAPPAAVETFARDMANYPIAIHTREANAQHYEVPARFFELTLGPRRKYSCCYYDSAETTLAQAEERALEETARDAGLADGQRILELGCGWGSLSLFMAQSYPNARITAVSNSASQRAYIEGRIAELGLTNLRVITADMNDFAMDQRFDRIVSIEMFEHMSNWRPLLSRLRGWLSPEGSLFIHIFTHRNQPYRFDHTEKADWIAQHFFTGGIMPSRQLIHSFGDLFEAEAEWLWSGLHYQRTAIDWLRNFDARRDEINAVLSETYGSDAALWRRRWRLFFLATEGLFGDRNGEEWGVSHYRLRPSRG
ncbi:class I SAM-dependent methyltransferase [Methylocystis sp. L43]|jgi:cyclopropane-fatty-acyl-phospholipid synthase|uniref:SAM-dependent methyltransferase n=1 Tax=unclassified Methylocystis TaxID=2625913 RepID=UPI0018C1F3B0|nr:MULTISPECIES: cyclopropane-fatty-acyl-phospholipid synthase family protein [unclassified Methylocystis]MBG0799537.1 class I SAM-dependent methyltransferase [Methylocystis sp. L43]MBG0807320.1 class I SAM-dependent methyltransferase [Methylocystis sp. H15]